MPHHLSLGALAGMTDLPAGGLRAALGLPADAFLVASFGFITPAKRLDVALRAFARLRREVPNALYLLVGEVSPHYDFASVLTPALAAGVVPVGLEFQFKWKVEGDVATLGAMEGKDIDHVKARLEGEYARKP